jgi:hypothetical protein
MLKRLFVSSSPFLKGKNRRYCHIQPNSTEISKKSLIKQKCNDCEEGVKELVEPQEKNISEINSKLTSFIEVQNHVNKQVFEDMFVYKLIIIATSISVSTGLLFSTGFWLASL